MRTVLAELAALGIHIGVRGESLRTVAPPEAVSPDLRARIVDRKPELLAMLAGLPGACFACFSWRWWTTPGLLGAWRCGACHPPVPPAVWALTAEEEAA